MSGNLYVLDGDVVREEPDAATWADFFENGNRIIEVSEGHTPIGRWQLLTFFLGWKQLGMDGGSYFFATQLAKGSSLETLEIQGQPALSKDMAEALSIHAEMLSRLRPFKRASQG